MAIQCYMYVFLASMLSTFTFEELQKKFLTFDPNTARSLLRFVHKHSRGAKFENTSKIQGTSSEQN